MGLGTFSISDHSERTIGGESEIFKHMVKRAYGLYLLHELYPNTRVVYTMGAREHVHVRTQEAE